MMSKFTRQGDVLFVPVTGEEYTKHAIPDKDIDKTGIIARGAHTHKVRPEDLDKQTIVIGSTWQTNWERVPLAIEVRDTIQIIHEEHGPVTLYPSQNAMGQTCPAYYQIKRAREFDVMSLAPRMVID